MRNPTKKPRSNPKPLNKANSAGGVVFAIFNRKPRFLLIKHHKTKHWSLPKGYVEEGETLEAAAAREIHEETGISAKPLEFLMHTEIFTVHERYRLLRLVHYYLLEATGSTELVPAKFDPEEKMIGDVRWFSPEEALRTVKYKNLHPVIRRATDRVKEYVHA